MHEELDIGDELHDMEPPQYDEEILKKFKCDSPAWNPFCPHYLCPICRSRFVVAPMASRRIRDLAGELSEAFDRTRDSLDLQDRGGLKTAIDWKPYFEFIF